MKKPILFLVALSILFSMAACDGNSKNDTKLSESEEMTFSVLQWPNTEIAKLLPVPKSNTGKIDWLEDYGFVIYVADTSAEDFNEYADECEEYGFVENYRRGKSYIFADNADGYRASVILDDDSIMLVRIDRPKEEPLPVTDPVPARSTPGQPEEADEAVETEKTVEPEPLDELQQNTVSEEDPSREVPESTNVSSQGDMDNSQDSFRNDSPSVTIPAQSETEGDLVWVPTKGGTKYHCKSSCSNMKDPIQVSRETAIANGYDPCKKCF